MTRIPLALSLAGLLAFGPLGCNRKSEAQIQAEAAAAKAEARVADLEKRLNEAAAGRGAEEADADTREQLTLGQKRALERQLRDAKVRAEARRRSCRSWRAHRGPLPPRRSRSSTFRPAPPSP